MICELPPHDFKGNGVAEERQEVSTSQFISPAELSTLSFTFDRPEERSAYFYRLEPKDNSLERSSPFDPPAEETIEATIEKETSWLRRQLSFSTINWKRAAILTLSGLSILHTAAKLNKYVELDSVRAAATQKMDPTAHQQSPWPENTTVYASSTQEQKGSSLHSYTQDVVDRLRSGDYKNFQDAHLDVERTGVEGFFHYFAQIPVSSPRLDHGWQIEHRDNRQVIIIQGEGHEPGFITSFLNADDETTFSRDAESFKSVMTEVFGVKEKNIHHMVAPTEKEVLGLIERVGATCDSDTEVMVYYVGHGMATPGQYSQEQGAASGTLALRDGDRCELLMEYTLKQKTSEHLSHVKCVSTVIDACYAGAFLARADGNETAPGITA